MKTFITILSLSASLAAVMAAPTPAGTIVSRAYADTSNQLTDGTACREVTVIYARGTSQEGNIGEATDVGPEFLNDLAALTGTANLAVQGVDYPATIPGFLAGGDKTGSALMASLATQASTQCPDTKLVLSGYSQGGQLTHNAAELISTAVTNFVSAVLVFGDPENGTAFGSIPASKVHVICHDGDGICLHTVIVTSQHLSYQMDAPAAAQWVYTALGY